MVIFFYFEIFLDFIIFLNGVWRVFLFVIRIISLGRVDLEFIVDWYRLRVVMSSEKFLLVVYEVEEMINVGLVCFNMVRFLEEILVKVVWVGLLVLRCEGGREGFSLGKRCEKSLCCIMGIVWWKWVGGLLWRMDVCFLYIVLVRFRDNIMFKNLF